MDDILEAAALIGLEVAADNPPIKRRNVVK